MIELGIDFQAATSELFLGGIALVLSATTVQENVTAGTTVGTFSVTGAPDGVTYTYFTTVGSSDYFVLSGATLQTAEGFTLDYETATSHTVEILALGSDSSSITTSFTISVTNVASGPIVVTYATPVEVADDAFSADEIVTFSASSSDSSDTFTYSLQSDVSGNFEVVGNALRAAAGASLVLDDVHSVTVRVTVPDGSYIDEAISVTVVAGGPAVADVFSIDLYTGNGTSQTITNGVDLSSEGGLWWAKSRTNYLSEMADTTRGINSSLQSSNTTGAVGGYTYSDVTSFNSDGVDLGYVTSNSNAPGQNFVGWTHRQAPKFFQIVEVSHTNGAATNVDLSSLGTVGMATVKRTDSTSNWKVWHRSLTSGKLLYLNLTDLESTDSTVSVSGTTLTISSTVSTGTYIVYAWAHDVADNGIIQCGSYTGNWLTNGPVVTLGWQPQWLLIKGAGNANEWCLVDATRGIGVGADPILHPNRAVAEDGWLGALDIVEASATGFQIKSTDFAVNAPDIEYIYIAIRAEGA